jgi:4-hydroxybenzoyl-CoA reductase subunit beta
MLRLPRFQWHRPATLDEATRLLADLNGAGKTFKVIAGGTDLVPNMKHEITVCDHVVSLMRLGLGVVHADAEDPTVRIGAMTTLTDVAAHEEVRHVLPALADACGQVAGPQLRNMGTLGGNVCLDTRCLYINQTYFWRQALGFCLKKDGSVCHVVKGGRNCVAAASNDTVLPLMLYGAELRFASVRGTRSCSVSDFFCSDGVFNKRMEPDEILTEIVVPRPSPRTHVTFEKLRVRRSIDFSLLNLAALVTTDESEAVERLELVVSGLGPKPKSLRLGQQLAGARLSEEVVAQAARKAEAACRPLTNLATDPAWRRAMVTPLTKRALTRMPAYQASAGTESSG